MIQDWNCWLYQRKMTKDEFLEVMENLDWEKDSVCEIFKTVKDAVHWYDDQLDDYLSDFYDEESGKEYVARILDNYGLYTTGTLLEKLKPVSGWFYVLSDGYMWDSNKEELKEVCDKIIKIVKEND